MAVLQRKNQARGGKNERGSCIYYKADEFLTIQATSSIHGSKVLTFFPI